MTTHLSVVDDNSKCSGCGKPVEPSWTGREVACSDACARKVRAALLDENDWVGHIARGVIPKRFQSAHSDQALPGMARVDFDSGRGVFLHGTTGVGKTHQAAIICRAAIRDLLLGVSSDEWQEIAWRNKPVMWRNAPAMLEEVRQSYSDKAVDPLPAARSARLLVIDDLGAEKPTDWVRERMYELVNHRYENQLPVVVTSNLSPKDLAAQVGRRVASRLAEMCEVVEHGGRDRRLAQR